MLLVSLVQKLRPCSLQHKVYAFVSSVEISDAFLQSWFVPQQIPTHKASGVNLWPVLALSMTIQISLLSLRIFVNGVVAHPSRSKMNGLVADTSLEFLVFLLAFCDGNSHLYKAEIPSSRADASQKEGAVCQLYHAHHSRYQDKSPFLIKWLLGVIGKNSSRRGTWTLRREACTLFNPCLCEICLSK